MNTNPPTRPALVLALMVTLSIAQSCAAAGKDAKPAGAAGLPPAEAGAKAALENSPRHGEFADVMVPGDKTPLKCFVVYPERKEKAPVVIATTAKR